MASENASYTKRFTKISRNAELTYFRFAEYRLFVSLKDDKMVIFILVLFPDFKKIFSI